MLRKLNGIRPSSFSMIPKWAGCTINDYKGCGPDGVPSYLYFRDSETHADSKGRYVEIGS